jgi:hypothetical protein
MRLIDSQSPSWRPMALNVMATLVYCALVIVLERILSSYSVLEQPLVIVVSTLLLAAVLSPLLILVWRYTGLWGEMQQQGARPSASAGALLGSVAAAIPTYVISVLLLQWATHALDRAGGEGSSVAITLATLVTLGCSTAVFFRLRRVLQSRATR